MFTVILLSPRARAVLGDPKVLFEPFEQQKQIAFCDWNQSPAAGTAREAMPGLDRLIEGHRAWRAIVVDVPSPTADPVQRTQRDNPFDYVANTQHEGVGQVPRDALNLEHSPHPFVRIAHLLLGYPDMGAKGFETVVTYLDGGSGERVLRQPADLGGGDQSLSDLVAELRSTHRDVQVGYQEIPYTEAERSAHTELRDWYSTKSLRPSEVVFIATREPLETDPKTQLNRAWQLESDRHRSRFIERNDYPPSSRFAVYDLVDRANSEYSLEEFRFWLSVLAVAVNQLPPSSFQADRVYRLQALVDEVELAKTLNAHLSHLAAVRDHIAALARNPTREPGIEVSEIIAEQHVGVEFTELGGERLGLATTGYGLATDRPRDELTRWHSDMRALRLEAEAFARKPRRVLGRAVFDARQKARAQVVREVELDDVGRAELEEELRRFVPALTEPTTSGILDRDRFDRMLTEHGAAVEEFIHQRLGSRTILTATAVVLLAALIGFVPYLLHAGTRGAATFAESLIVVVLVLCVLAATGLLALLVMRWRLITRIGRLNSALGAFVSGVGSGAVAFGEYLSTLATYMHGRSVLEGSDLKHERDLGRRRRLGALHGKVVGFMESEKAILLSLGRPITIQRLPDVIRDFDVDNDRRIERIFQFPVGERRAELNESGDYIRAPYDFVSRLRVERVTLLEPSPIVEDQGQEAIG